MSAIDVLHKHLGIEPNKVSLDLNQYTMIFSGDSGIGKTTSMFNFLTSIAPKDKVPLFLEFEDRFANIPGIEARKINSVEDLMKVINILKIPEVKEAISCIVIDTIDKYEEICERHVAGGEGGVILKDVGPFGEGDVRYKSYMPSHIGTIQRLGYTVHGIYQTDRKKDFDKDLDMEKQMLKRSTFNYFRQAAYLVGCMSKDSKSGERYITFEKTNKLPDLKDCFNLPKKIKISELKEVLTKSIKDMGEENITTETTINREVKQELSFDEVMSNIEKYGNLLFDNGYTEDAVWILKKNLGTDKEGNVISYNTLGESQIEIAKVIAFELKELVDKHDLK